MRWQHGMTQPQIPLNGNGQSHEYGSSHGHVCHGENQIWKQIGVNVGIGFECAKGVIDAAANDVQDVETRQGEEELRGKYIED